MPLRRKEQKPTKHEQPSQQSLSPEMSKLARGVVEIATALHDNWRESLRVGEGGYLPDVEETKDKEWIRTHGSGQVDIANTNFEELPRDWQAENIAAARVVLGLLLEGGGYVWLHRDGEEERVGGIIHDAWVQRHPEAAAEGLDVPFAELPWDQQDKDLDQAHIGMQVWARMKLAEQADRGYEGDETVTDPRTGDTISARQLLDDVHSQVREAEIIRQVEAPTSESKELRQDEVLRMSKALLAEVYDIVRTWQSGGGEKKVSEYRGKVSVRLFAKNARGDLCEVLLSYSKGDDLEAKPRSIQVTCYDNPNGVAWPRERYIDIKPAEPTIRETNYPYHEEDLALTDENTDTAVQKARNLIERLPGYQDPTLA